VRTEEGPNQRADEYIRLEGIPRQSKKANRHLSATGEEEAHRGEDRKGAPREMGEEALLAHREAEEGDR
jgi:hypothetical protein